MLAIKLSRVGKKKQPSYRLIVVEKTKDPWGKAKEIVGFYNPRTKPKTITLEAERIKYWITKGAQPTETVWNILVDAQIVKGNKRKAHPPGKGKPVAKESPKKEEAKV